MRCRSFKKQKIQLADGANQFNAVEFLLKREQDSFGENLTILDQQYVRYEHGYLISNIKIFKGDRFFSWAEIDNSKKTIRYAVFSDNQNNINYYQSFRLFG